MTNRETVIQLKKEEAIELEAVHKKYVNKLEGRYHRFTIVELIGLGWKKGDYYPAMDSYYYIKNSCKIIVDDALNVITISPNSRAIIDFEDLLIYEKTDK